MAYISFEMLVNRFYEGETSMVSSGSGNLKIVNNQLIHYQTVIAERDNDGIIINMTRYSLETGKIQKMLSEKGSMIQIKTVKSIPKDYKGSLLDYL